MKIRYGGIELKVVTVEIERTQVYAPDNTSSYLWTEYAINAICMANSDQPQSLVKPGETFGMSWVRDPGVGGTGALAPKGIKETVDSKPPLTDISIRHWLGLPRRKLIVEVDGVVMIESPVGTDTVDVQGGPQPTVFPIRTSFGDGKSFLYNWQCKTWLRDCVGAEDRGGSALVSNRFSQHQELDQDYFITTVTEGTAHFRMDVLAKSGANPDSIRPLLFLPIPYGFKRENIQVSNEPGTGVVHYRFTDRQQASQLVVGDEIGATRAEVNYEQVLLTDQDVIGGVLGTVQRHQEIKWYADQMRRQRGPTEAIGNKPRFPSNRPVTGQSATGKPGTYRPGKYNYPTP